MARRKTQPEPAQVLPPDAPGQIDALMDRASEALVSTRYFEAERQALRALGLARQVRDYERMARICLPLQEARRQKRQLACDASAGGVTVLSSLSPPPLTPGCYLLAPPLIGADARRLRETLDAREVPAFVLTREPMTRAGQWPVVAVGEGMLGPVSVRVRLAPPAGVEPDASTPTKDRGGSSPPVAWFESAGEALGDAAIARVKPTEPAAHRVDDLLDFLSAFPDHEKLHQRLGEACRQAGAEPEPALPRRRPVVDDPHSF